MNPPQVPRPMPSLIVKRKGHRKVPPCGRLIEYLAPHSPFQKLIDSQRKRYYLSGRDLAERIDVSQSTLWIWLHNTNGFPHPKSFKPVHVERLSKTLKIPQNKIRSALDASRHIFTPTENPMPHEQFEALGRFIEILENDKRKTISKEYALNLARNLYRGAKVAKLLLFATLTWLTVHVSSASDSETLTTLKGQHYEKVRVTEVTPATVAFKHSAGVCRIPIAEFPIEVRQRFGYDEAKARAWIAAQTQQMADATKPPPRTNKIYDVEHVAALMRSGAIDPTSGRFYLPDTALQQRAEAFEWLQRYGSPRPMPQNR